MNLMFVTLVLTIALSMAAPTTLSFMSYKADMRVHPFAEMPLPNYYLIDGATVAIEFGFNPGFDDLLLDYQGDFPITSSFSSQNGILYLSGTAPISEYSAAIQSVVFTTSSSDGANRVITFTYGQSTTYATSTQHFYRYVLNPANSWVAAQQDCAGRTYMGMQGYLATITSDREMVEVVGRTLFSTWLGAQSNADGNWSWVSGPEGLENGGSGRNFWNGASMYSGGQPANWLSFNQWYRFRPNSASSSYLSSKPPLYSNVAYLYNTDNTELVEGWVCEFGGLDSAAVAASTWQFTGSMTLKFDCGLFVNVSDCANHADFGCQWNFGMCQATDCSRHLLQSRCLQDWKCAWNVNGDSGLCTNTECSVYGDINTCSADNNCKFSSIGGSKQCLVAACSDKTTSCGCTAMSGCSWLNGACYSTPYLGCSGMDVVYLLDGTVNMSQAFERYPNGFIGLTQSLLDTDFALTGLVASAATIETTPGARVAVVQFGGAKAILSPTGIGSGGALTGSKLQLQADLKFQQSAFTASVTTRYVMPAINTALTMLSKSSRKKVIVVISSGGIDDAAANAATIQKKLGTTTLIGVTLKATEPVSQDAINSYNSLALLTSNLLNTTMTNFKAVVAAGLCGTTPLTAGTMVIKTGLVAIGGAPLCSTFTSRSSCTFNNPGCSWDPAGQQCQQSGCLSYCSQSMCANDPSCSWQPSAGACLQACPQMNQNSNCGSQKYSQICVYNSSSLTCKDKPCVSNPTEDACIGDSNNKCVYNPNVNTLCFQDKCTGVTNQQQCLNSGNGCGWSQDGNCFVNYCLTKNATQCMSYAQCQWNNGSCVLTECGQHVSEQGCQADRKCTWDASVAPAGCAPALCRNLTTVDDCATNPTCYWQPQSENGYQDMCVIKPCYANPRACDCAAQDGCVWTNNTCKDTTFVQCPAMDVVFLIESTPQMQFTFGNHPNGFVGIVEAIRSWSNTVPMSAMLSSPGFRLAVAGYGYQQTPLQPPAAIGGQDFCNNQTKFTGVNNILDTFLSLQPSYGAQTSGEVAILPGLQAVTQLFNTSSPATRTKLLMILGNSAITDGAGSSVSSQLSALEGLNVQVFSNVIRRFSVIAPVETVAAASLKPLATDPVQMHYSFSTIDDMQKNILESFCDPSTTIGQALDISRDGTLPCNWLSESECGLQASCMWNATEMPTCPLPGQCPNLGCVALPPSLASHFECKQCSYEGGAFSCDASQSHAAVPGVCTKTPCSANCGLSSCAGSCSWNGQASRCERAMCTATDAVTCNLDLGCVWDGPTGACRHSVCSAVRSSTGCTGLSPDGSSHPCQWNTTLNPAVCEEARCRTIGSNKATCNLFPILCSYSDAASSCVDNLCQYSNAEACNGDSGCYWDPYTRKPGTFGTCNARQLACQLSDFSAWSPCTASCGSNAVRTRTRAIKQFPQPLGLSCADVASSLVPPGISQSLSCSNSSQYCSQFSSTTCALDGVCQWVGSSCVPLPWQSDCGVYCSKFATSVTQCISDLSCQWANLTCVPRPTSGCASFATSAQCAQSDMCTWDSTMRICIADPQTCQFTEASTCSSGQNCQWRTGANANANALALQTTASLVNPGQAPIHPFPVLSINSDDVINGASVSIESGYQLGKDVLEMSFPTTIVSKWFPSSGMMVFQGAASVSEYSYVIRATTFSTSSLSTGSRVISWTLGNNTMFAEATGHFYRYYPQSGVTWDNAKFACASTSHYGLQGYIATITSGTENSVIATKLSADGWVSGDDASRGQWQLDSGPESGSTIWIGGSSVSGGTAATNAYANWDDMAGQPIRSTTQVNHIYLNQSGYWWSKGTSDPTAKGYVCEYGGMAADLPSNTYDINGATVIGIAGCLPVTPCIYHVNQGLCNADPQCNWVTTGPLSSCVVGCATYSTVSECSSGSNCIWDTSVLPPVCTLNSCANVGAADCNSRPQCIYQNGCKMRTGCPRFSTSGASACNAMPSCTWDSQSSPASCVTRGCSQLPNQPLCIQNPLCQWNPLGYCSDIICQYGSSSQCTSDTRCAWKDALSGTASFSAAGGQTILPFNLVPLSSPQDSSLMVDGITIMITGGFQVGQDVMAVSPSDNVGGTWLVSWNALSGVLTLRVAPGVQMSAINALIQMKKVVKFYSSSSTQMTRTLQYTLALSTYTSPTTGLLYRLVPGKFATTYPQAEAICEASSLFGSTGVLAQIVNQQDNLALRSLGASGFVGATLSQATNQWMWSSATPSVPFWQGYGSTGLSVNASFAAWSAGEPLGSSAFVVLNPSGTWKSIPANGNTYYPVLCQYTAPNPNTDPVSNTMVTIQPTGCFVRYPCEQLPRAACISDPECAWNTNTAGNSSCTTDQFCVVASSASSCVMRQGCYWDYVYGSCRNGLGSVCDWLSMDACASYSQCRWTPSTQMRPRYASATGFCRLIGCTAYPNQDSCTADTTCLWQVTTAISGQCVSRACGYPKSTQCWQDNACEWNATSSVCQLSKCATLSASQCASSPKCASTSGSSSGNVCGAKRCSSGDRVTCQSDTACGFSLATGCYLTSCLSLTEKTPCESNSQCYFSDVAKSCLASVCLTWQTQPSCAANVKTCAWVVPSAGGSPSCKEMSFMQQQSPASVPIPGTCPSMTLLWYHWVLVGVDYVILMGILYRVYLAFAKGWTFFTPLRRAKKFDYSQYSADLFKDAQDFGIENNGVNYGRPSLNDL